MEALQRLMQGRTTFVIAHRLSTIEHADLIVVLEHGQVREADTHRNLMRAGGLYARLHALQFADAPDGVKAILGPQRWEAAPFRPTPGSGPSIPRR